MVVIGVGRTSSGWRVAATGIVAAVVAGAVNVGIAALAAAVGVPQVVQLGAPGVVLVTLVACAVAVVGWQLVRARAVDPARLLRRLVPAVLVASFVPDVLLGLVIASAVGWTPVIALASMHVTTAAVVLAACGRLLPVRSRTA